MTKLTDLLQHDVLSKTRFDKAPRPLTDSCLAWYTRDWNRRVQHSADGMNALCLPENRLCQDVTQHVDAGSFRLSDAVSTH